MLAVSLLSFGCQKRQLSLGETADLMNEVSDILGSVKDAKAFESAKPTLKPKLNRMRESNELAKAKQPAGNKAPSKEEMDRITKEMEKLKNDPNWEKFQQAMGRYIQEVFRVSMAVPGAGDWIAQESGGTWNQSGSK